MHIEIWNKNARDGKIAIEKENTERFKAGCQKEVNIQESKSNLLVAPAKIVGDIMKSYIDAKSNKQK